MKGIYRRERGHNYLLLFSEENGGGEDEGRYTQTEMVRRNQIRGMAPLRTGWEDNRRYYEYDITGMQPMARVAEFRELTGTDVRTLLEQLAELLLRMEPYLLDRDGLVLEPEFLYLRPDRMEYAFFFYPDQKEGYRAHMRDLARYLLEHSNGEDRELMELTVRFFRICAGEGPEPEQIFSCLDGYREADAHPETGFPELQAEHDEKQEPDTGKHPTERGKRFGKIRELLKRIFAAKPYPEEEMWDELDPCDQRVPELSEGMSGKIRTERADPRTELLYVEETEGGGPALYEKGSGQRILLDHVPFYVGTGRDADYSPQSCSVSRMHLKIDRGGDGYRITDLNSTNGTRLNGCSLRPNEQRTLRSGDEIWAAGILYEFREFDTGEKS